MFKATKRSKAIKRAFWGLFVSVLFSFTARAGSEILVFQDPDQQYYRTAPMAEDAVLESYSPGVRFRDIRTSTLKEGLEDFKPTEESQIHGIIVSGHGNPRAYYYREGEKYTAAKLAELLSRFLLKNRDYLPETFTIYLAQCSGAEEIGEPNIQDSVLNELKETIRRHSLPIRTLSVLAHSSYSASHSTFEPTPFNSVIWNIGLGKVWRFTTDSILPRNRYVPTALCFAPLIAGLSSVLFQMAQVVHLEPGVLQALVIGGVLGTLGIVSTKNTVERRAVLRSWSESGLTTTEGWAQTLLRGACRGLLKP